MKREQWNVFRRNLKGPVHFRPSEAGYLCGDSSYARKLLGWKPKINFEGLVEIMVKHDYDFVRKEANIDVK